jgi:hypothetical protein
MVISKSLIAAVADNIAQSQALAAAGNLTLNGTTVVGGVATLDTQRRIGITSGGNDTGITFTVYGTMQGGTAISETVTGASGGVATTTRDFLTLTRVAASGAVATTVEVGTTDVGATPWLLLDAWQTPFEVGIAVVVSGTVNFTVQETSDLPMPGLQIYNAGFNQTVPIPTPFDISALASKAANTEGSISDVPRNAIRLVVNSGTGTATMTAIQAGPTT